MISDGLESFIQFNKITVTVICGLLQVFYLCNIQSIGRNVWYHQWHTSHRVNKG